MIPESAQVAAMVVLPLMLFVGLAVWLITTQRKEASARGQYLEAFTMAEKLGVKEEFAKLKNSPEIGQYIGAMRACDQCRGLEGCHEFLESKEDNGFAAARKFCPNVDLFLELRRLAA